MQKELEHLPEILKLLNPVHRFKIPKPETFPTLFNEGLQINTTKLKVYHSAKLSR
jgi:hypothetical protein